MTERTYTRLVVSYLSWHSGLSWNSGVLIKTSEGISFSIAHLSPLKQLRCKYGQELLWFVDDKPPKRTNLPILSVASSPLKAWTAKDKMQLWWSRVIYSWSWLVLRSDKDSLGNHHLTTFTRFFRRDIKIFSFNQLIFFILTVQLRSEHLKANVFGMLFTSVWLKRYSLKRCSWFVISIRQKLLVSQNARKCATIQLHKVTSSKTKILKCVLKSFKEKAKRKRIINNISSEAPSFIELWVSNFIPGCDRFPAIFPGRDPREMIFHVLNGALSKPQDRCT